MPDGDYEVTLRFMDPTAVAVGQRIFAVDLNGTVVATALDLVAVAGPRTAYDVVGGTTASAGAGVRVGFRAAVGLPVVSGIDVRRV